jgi:iron complex outermembrane recepter protein
MKKIWTLTIMLACFACLTSSAQTRTLTGRIKDENGEAVFATISIKGGKAIGATDATGAFSIVVDLKGKSLLFTSVGFEPTEVRPGSDAALSVVMRRSVANGNEAVVTALGINRKQRSVGYSVQEVKGDNIIIADPPNIAQGLMGKVAGLNISVPNGVEGGSERIVIRGNTSILGNNQPMIVVDGVIIDNEPILPGGVNFTTQNLTGQVSTNSSQNADYGSFLNTINPDDVESVSVLKGPNASALYGSRGSNGVILITLKKGKAAKGLGVNYSIDQRWTSAYRFPKMQHEYGSGFGGTFQSADMNNLFMKTSTGQYEKPGQYDWTGLPAAAGYGTGPSIGNYALANGYAWGPKIDGRPVVYSWPSDTVIDYTPNTNLYSSFLKTGYSRTQNINFSGGNNVGTLRFSYTRYDNDAITYNSNNNNNVFNFGGSLTISPKVKAEVSLTYSNINKLNPPGLNDGGFGGIVVNSGISPDYKPLEKIYYKNADGSQNSGSPYSGSGLNTYWWNINENKNTFTQNQFLGSIKIVGDILPWLRATAQTSLDYYTNQFISENAPVDATHLVLGSGGIIYSNDLSRVSIPDLSARVDAHKTGLLKNLDVNFAIQGETYQFNSYDMNGYNKGPLLYPGVYSFVNYNATAGGDGNRQFGEASYVYKTNSILGLLDLAYRNYLYLELTGRNDWTSTLNPKDWSFFFPGANLSFVFTDALNIHTAGNWLSYGKIYASQSYTANGYVPYQTIPVYNQTTSSPGVPYGGFLAGFTYPQTLPALGINPQKTRSFEIGTNLRFLNNRIEANFAYYNMYSYNQILPAAIPQSSGATNVTTNIGALTNQGIELTINATVLKERQFQWNLSVNAAHNSNKVDNLGPNLNQIDLGNWYGSNGISSIVKVGQQYGTIYGTDYLYHDGKKVINQLTDASGNVYGSTFATTPTAVPLGNSVPSLTGGISNTFTFKNFSLYVLTDFRVGGKIWSADYEALMGQGLAPETVKERDGHGLPYTFPDGTSSNIGVILPGVVQNSDKSYSPNTAVVNAWWKYAGAYQSWSNIPLPRSNSVFTDSWGKLRELALTYQIPADLIKKTKVFQNLTVSLIGRDLFYLFSSLPDRLNPESLSGTSNNQTVQYGSYPATRSLGFSIKAGF